MTWPVPRTRRGWAVWALAAVAVAVTVVLGIFTASTGEPWRWGRAVGAGVPMAMEGLSSSSTQVARGAYLARVGNCMGCHTVQGSAPYAGGRSIETPFGQVRAPNLTPDDATGLGRWSADEFWTALHEGRSRDGRLLYPAFPYTSYTSMVREDADALWAYLRTVEPVHQPNLPHALKYPYSTQWALAGWRALFFRPGEWRPDLARPPEWNRGAYLVQSLGHCAACHTPRNALGGSKSRAAWAGGMLDGQGWYAPALNDPAQAGLQDWPVEDIVALLRVGTTPRAAVSGPMAEVVVRSTQYLDDADARAVAVYLQSLPLQRAEPEQAAPAVQTTLQRGQGLYTRHCAQCHGDGGEGVAGAMPPLAGNRAVVLQPPVNVIRTILHGGYLPATAGNPRPHGMPPFLHVLSDEEIADVATFIRNAWGNTAPSVGTIDVYRAR